MRYVNPAMPVTAAQCATRNMAEFISIPSLEVSANVSSVSHIKKLRVWNRMSPTPSQVVKKGWQCEPTLALHHQPVLILPAGKTKPSLGPRQLHTHH